MLSIKKLDKSPELENYLTENALTKEDAPQQYMALYDDSRLCGLGSLSLCGPKVYLNFLHAKDSSLCYGLAKALLNMADLNGIETIYGSNPSLEALYISLRFQKDGAEFSLSLAGYFSAKR